MAQLESGAALLSEPGDARRVGRARRASGGDPAIGGSGAGAGLGWAAKDSFAALDLSAFGFRLLFEARRIHRAPSTIAPQPEAHRVASESELAAWEHAWSGGAPEQSRMFPAALLAEQDHAVIALERDGAIVAGCIASRSAGVLGISNLFAPVDDDGSDRSACLAAAARFAPGLLLVDYESGDDLACMKALGFAEIGLLRVWESAS